MAATAAVTAAERATFVLTDGERVSGEVVFHTEERTNIRADKNEFNVKINSGVEMPIPFAQVVAIDFAGGQPRAEEIAALPGNGQLLALRNGENRTGRLVDFIGGTTVRWKNSDGQDVDLPMSDVRRVYLRPDRVRDVYNIPQTAPSNAAVPATQTPSRITQAVSGPTVTVRGALPWTDTGLAVRTGQMVRFQATGEVFVTRTQGVNPDGMGNPNGAYPDPTMPIGTLIAKIGTNGKAFSIGTTTDAIRMPATGRLMLGINDDNFDDNSGSFRVVVAR
jgi:hypothetical protein